MYSAAPNFWSSVLLKAMNVAQCMSHTMLKVQFLSKNRFFYISKIQPTLICRCLVTLISGFSVIFDAKNPDFDS